MSNWLESIGVDPMGALVSLIIAPFLYYWLGYELAFIFGLLSKDSSVLTKVLTCLLWPVFLYRWHMSRENEISHFFDNPEE